ncbi:MAG: hypothetical protein ACI4AM_10535 [Muribaculaceae bacterium]
MTHTDISFDNLQQALSRCGEKLATEAINEIRTAINQAVAQAATAAEVDTLLRPVQTTVEAAQTARREKAAARRAAQKAAQAEATAEQSKSSDARPGSCGEAEAELPAPAFTPEMVKYLRRCPDQYMLAVLNSYIHLILTGNLIHTADDHRYLDNFITLARTLGIIDNPEPLTALQAATFLCDNPALPLPRAQRRALERLRRKQARRSHSEKV